MHKTKKKEVQEKLVQATFRPSKRDQSAFPGIPWHKARRHSSTSHLSVRSWLGVKPQLEG